MYSLQGPSNLRVCLVALFPNLQTSGKEEYQHMYGIPYIRMLDYGMLMNAIPFTNLCQANVMK